VQLAANKWSVYYVNPSGSRPKGYLNHSDKHNRTHSKPKHMVCKSDWLENAVETFGIFLRFRLQGKRATSPLGWWRRYKGFFLPEPCCFWSSQVLTYVVILRWRKFIFIAHSFDCRVSTGTLYFDFVLFFQRDFAFQNCPSTVVVVKNTAPTNGIQREPMGAKREPKRRRKVTKIH